MGTRVRGCLLCILLFEWSLESLGTAASSWTDERPKLRRPLFSGSVQENWPIGTKVNGLNIPLNRINPEPWCSRVTGRRLHLELIGDKRSRFEVYFHHRHAQLSLKTTQVLDREERSRYVFRLGLCCKLCASPEHVVTELAVVTVHVLDVNDNAPQFAPTNVNQSTISLDETTRLKSVVYRVTAHDPDQGTNADLVYFAEPMSTYFFIIPKTGQVVLVESLLNVKKTLNLTLYARDHGQPPLVSAPLEVQICPRVKKFSVPSKGETYLGFLRRKRASPLPDAFYAFSVAEDAAVGSAVSTLESGALNGSSFELVSSLPGDCPLVVNWETGDVTLARTLDRESAAEHQCLIRVLDSTGRALYFVHLEVTVTDVNDDIPRWTMEPSPFLATVSPSAGPGTRVYELHAIDQDKGMSGEVEYFLLEGGEDRFVVGRSTGWIETTGQGLQEGREYLLAVQAADKLGMKGSPAVVSVIVGVRPPQFKQTSYAIRIPESTAPGSTLATVSAVSHQNNPLSYSMVTSPQSFFSIDRITGDVGLIRAVDYESDPHQFVLGVTATENPSDLKSTVQVAVEVTDVNDCKPEFQQRIYSKDNVPETVPVATALLQVTATDCDSGLNGEVSYYTLSPDFSISAEGTISPVRELDFERPNHLYEFVILAVDRGDDPNTGTATVRIRVSNVNDEAPEFSQTIYRTFVSEEAGPNTLVATVHAFDPDGDHVTYNISEGNREGNFIIDPEKGVIRLGSNLLPKHHGAEYELFVTATDDNASGGPHRLTSTTTVIVRVDDVNQNKPVFQKCAQYRRHAVVLENQPPGTFVLQVEATDADVGVNGQVKYGIVHREGSLPAFSIHPDTGVLTTLQSFDREKQKEFTVTIKATDQAAEPLIGLCQINIQIQDQNDNDPSFENNHYEYFLREDAAVGTSFLRVAARDDDYGVNGTIKYSVSGEDPGAFSINTSTGWLHVSQPISRKSLVTLEVTATDGGNRSTQVEVAVRITDAQNQPPVWEKEKYDLVIPENTMRDTPVVTVKASSLLGDPRVTYNLEEGLVPETNMPVRFYLTVNREEGSASVLVAEPLDYETTKNFILKIRAQTVAAVPLAAFTTVYINVTDVNDNVPFFTSSIYEATVTEGLELGTFVLQVSASDQDLGLNGEITYSILEDRSGDHALFHIDPDTGVIYTAAVFDREAKASYLLEVMSSDGSESARPGKHGQPNSDSAYVRIFISDVNDNPPAFARRSYRVDVQEDQDVGSVAALVSATDPDEGMNAKIRYQITAGNNAGALDVDPETGAVFIFQPLNYEEVPAYELTVLASDGKWEDYTAVIINILNKNDEAPVFSQGEYQGHITEELSELPVLVLQVSAVDPDDREHGSMKYSLHGSGADSVFTIHERTGGIFAQKPLDREEHALWRFVVLATDEGGDGLTGFADVIIYVDDVNDHVPHFTCERNACSGSVLENAPANTSIMEMSAVDRDDKTKGLNAVLTYSIINSPLDLLGRSIFSIDSDTGVIYTAFGNLDREETGAYLLLIEAEDGGGMRSTGTATINVLDINDHAPAFTQDMCYAAILETSEINSDVLQVWAVDADDGENALLSFSIVGGDPGHVFIIESDQRDKRAVIKLNKVLDYEVPQERSFNLTVEVRDRDFSTISTCLIELQDCNDNPPVFIPSLLQVPPLPENVTLGSTVARVTASDADSGLNGRFVYGVHSESDVFGQFYVDQSGAVKVAKALDREVTSQYRLVILASDLGTPAQTGSATVFIDILDVNDNGPTLDALYKPIVWENAAWPQRIRINETSDLLYAVDLDTAENGAPFTFTLPNDHRNSSTFMLIDHGNSTASIETLRSFDREAEKTFYLPVIITDSGEPPRAATSTLTITIGDQNDNPHQGAHKDIFVYILETGWSSSAIGKVLVLDEDEWDTKLYSAASQIPATFWLNQTDGTILMTERPPQGTYDLRVKVSDGVWPDTFSTITIYVREIGGDALRSSVSMRLTNITAEEFIEKDEFGVSRREQLQAVLAEMAAAHPNHVHMFSVARGPENATDVTFSVCVAASCHKPEMLQSTLAAQREKIQSVLKERNSHVAIDFCSHNSACIYRGAVSGSPPLVDGGSVSFVSIPQIINTSCKYPAPHHAHRNCSSLPQNPCLNGGTCSSSLTGYRCHCLPPFHGPRCQQTQRAFHGHGYAWFPPMSHCSDSHLSLEFVSDVADGLLLYSGPPSSRPPGDSQNFIAIEVVSGRPLLTFRQHSTTLRLALPEPVNVTDGEWHRIDLRIKGQEVSLTLDRCGAAVISEAEGIGGKLLTEDRTGCEVQGVITQDRRFWEPHAVLQLGGVKQSPTHSYHLLTHKHFKGCLRNVILNKQMYDLEAPLEAVNSSPGCARKGTACLSPASCDSASRCVSGPGTPSCDCPPTHHAQDCGKDAREHFFHPGGHVRYLLPHALHPQWTHFQATIRTRDANSTIMSLSSKDQSEYIRLQVAHGLLTVSYDLGDGPNIVTLPGHKLDTGEWNEVALERMQNEFTLRLNGGGEHREITAASGTYKEIKVDPRGAILGSIGQSGYQGCIKNARLNNYRLPMENTSASLLSVISREGVSEGCVSDACSGGPCTHGFVCIDLWMKHECRCPPGFLLSENATDPHCIYTVCASHPCKYGSCLPRSPAEFTCLCAEGYDGSTCHIPTEDFSPGLWFSTLYMILICLLTVTVLIAGILLWSHCKRKKTLNQGVYHVSGHSQDLEDTRQNIFHYNEEGGGHEDHDAFNVTELQLCVRSSPAHAFCRKTGALHGDGPLSCDYETSVSQKELSHLPASERSCSFTSGDFGRYFYDVFQEAAYIQQALSCDSLKVYHVEGDGSPAGSLSTLASSGAEGDAEYEEEMRHWGPKFVNLCKLYSYTDDDDPQ